MNSWHGVSYHSTYIASDEGYLKAISVPYWYLGPAALILLQCLHIFWASLVIVNYGV